MALITDAIDNKVATVDWVCDRLTTNGYGIPLKKLIFDIEFKYNSLTVSARVTYECAARALCNNIGQALKFIPTSCTKAMINNSLTDPYVLYLWNDLCEIFIPVANYDSIIVANKTQVPELIYFEPEYYSNGGGFLISQIKQYMSPIRGKTYISKFELYDVIDSSENLLYVTHSGIELGENYIGGSKGPIFETADGTPIQNDSKKCILGNEFGFVDNNKALLETDIRDYIKDNIIYPIIGDMYIGDSTTRVNYATINQDVRIRPPHFSGIGLYEGNTVATWNHSFLCTNSTALFVNLPSILYEPEFPGQRAYFGDIHYGIKATPDPNMLTLWGVPDPDPSIEYTGGFKLKPNGSMVSVLPEYLNVGNQLKFFDNYSRTPYLNPSILIGVAPTNANYVERHVVKYPTPNILVFGRKLYERYYHPTLTQTRLADLGLISIPASYLTNVLPVPIIVVPSTIYVNNYAHSVDSTDCNNGAISVSFSIFKNIKLRIYDYAYAYDSPKGHSTSLKSSTGTAIQSAIENSKVLIETYYGSGSGTPNKTAEYKLSNLFTVSFTNGTSPYFTLTGKTGSSLTAEYKNQTYTRIKIKIIGNTVDLDKKYFLFGPFGTTYKTESSDMQIASYEVTWTGVSPSAKGAAMEIGEYDE